MIEQKIGMKEYFWNMYLATLGVSIKNLMRERERNVEQGDREKLVFFSKMTDRLFQTMKIMGLNSTINFISWLISSFIPMIIVSIIVAGEISIFDPR